MSVNIQTAEGLKKVAGKTPGSTTVTSDAVVNALGYTPANKNHTHTEYPTTDQMSSAINSAIKDKADAGHQHPEYALKEHTHTEYAAKDHKHNNIAKSKTYNLNSTDIINSAESCTYGFNYSSSYPGLVSTNKSDKTFSYAKLTFTMPGDGSLKITFYQSSEKNYDYGWISNIDMDLPKNYDTTTEDTTVAYNAKGLDGSSSYTFSNVTKGQHYITIRYRKDSSTSTASDEFVITSLVANYNADEYTSEERVLELISEYMSENYENGDTGSY